MTLPKDIASLIAREKIPTSSPKDLGISGYPNRNIKI